MGLELTTDKYPPITSQTRYLLRHAASITAKDWSIGFYHITYLFSMLTDNSEYLIITLV